MCLDFPHLIQLECTEVDHSSIIIINIRKKREIESITGSIFNKYYYECELHSNE